MRNKSRLKYIRSSERILRETVRLIARITVSFFPIHKYRCLILRWNNNHNIHITRKEIRKLE